MSAWGISPKLILEELEFWFRWESFFPLSLQALFFQMKVRQSGIERFLVGLLDLQNEELPFGDSSCLLWQTWKLLAWMF